MGRNSGIIFLGNVCPTKTRSNPNQGRVYDSSGCAPSLNTVGGGNLQPMIVTNDYRIRKLTPRECWRLMGFSDDAFDRAQSAGISNSQLYKQAGNSIVTDVLYYIMRELYSAMPYLFDDLRVGSYFSGIGAFEFALDRLYKEINDDKASFFGN